MHYERHARQPQVQPKGTQIDFDKGTNKEQLAHIFQPANPISFDIKINYVFTSLRDTQFDKRRVTDPYVRKF